ncbi:MAG TPA: hypothetical protein VF613_10770 [Longimicrobium sp.]|jgi:hypothetical protein
MRTLIWAMTIALPWGGCTPPRVPSGALAARVLAERAEVEIVPIELPLNSRVDSVEITSPTPGEISLLYTYDGSCWTATPLPAAAVDRTVTRDTVVLRILMPRVSFDTACVDAVIPHGFRAVVKAVPRGKYVVRVAEGRRDRTLAVQEVRVQ